MVELKLALMTLLIGCVLIAVSRSKIRGQEAVEPRSLMRPSTKHGVRLVREASVSRSLKPLETKLQAAAHGRTATTCTARELRSDTYAVCPVGVNASPSAPGTLIGGSTRF
jgi:hypothetical protein